MALRKMRLLALDGGGIRGLSSLFILQDVMLKVQFAAGLSNVPQPCDYFDMICGTSTGGIIAIMLGRLKMSVSECISAYVELGKAVFGNENGYHKRTQYSAEALERAIARVVRLKTGQEDTKFVDDTCTKTYVSGYGTPEYGIAHIVQFRYRI